MVVYERTFLAGNGWGGFCVSIPASSKQKGERIMRTYHASILPMVVVSGGLVGFLVGVTPASS